ncbi:MAG: class I SAM-dependent methyltransferase [Acidobacteriota bacterium]|nr:class I SAM-dependent methyltransferase [Acidobacteriota bacterium]
MGVQIADVRAFWEAHPCNSSYSNRTDRRAYFEEIERRRFETEPHIPIVAQFDQFKDKDVLEVGCGIGTDGFQFARHGARYTGIDLAPTAVAITRERFELFGIPGRFEVANAEERIPFADASFDHVYSCGVIHHSPDTEAIVREMYRVLRPGGTLCVMIYNKTSINYYLQIMFLRKLFRWLLYPSFMPALVAKLTGFERWKLERHREIMLTRGRLSKQEWISMNTDGPDCPLAKVYTAAEALALFKDFTDVRTEVWHFNRLHWPLIGRLLPERLVQFLGRRWGWHRFVFGRKPLRAASHGDVNRLASDV